MKKMSANKIYLPWIDGLKYTACLGVFFSHFCSAFIEFDKNIYAVDNLSPVIIELTKILSMFLNGAFWVRLFCVISGLLAGYKVIESGKELFKSIINRYLRFVIPFFTLGLFLLIIEYTLGYHAVQCGELLNASWLGTHNTEAVTISEIFKMAFLFDHSIDAPLWTMRPVFAGSCIVYLVGFLLKKINIPEKYWGGIWIILFLLSIIKYTIDTLCVSCCILGAAIPYFWKRIRIPQWLSNFFIFVVVLLVSGIHQWFIEGMIELGVDVPVRFGLDGYGDVIYSVGLLLLINKSNVLKRILSFRTSYSKSSMSFSIYIFHMPLIMSVSTLICIKLYNYVNYSVNCLINIIISTSIVWGVSYIYTCYVDKYQNRLLKKFDEFLVGKKKKQ